MNYDYPEASYERRREIIQEHDQLPAGLAVLHRQRPARARRRADRRWRSGGWPKDEFNRQRPLAAPDLRARGAAHDRRYVMTENELLKRRPTPEPVGMGSYGIDSHNVQRYITPEGYVQNEGDIGVSTKARTRSPTARWCRKRARRRTCWCRCACRVRTSPTARSAWSRCFMILGQSAATAAVMAIDGGLDVQDVPYDKLRARLLADGQVLEYTAPAPAK
jgi:hypothetical protein